MPDKYYSETIDWLFEQFPAYQFVGASAYKPTLDNTRSLCALYNHPEDHLKFVHIAGTNGKGSTSSMLASILTEAGEKVGLFTSPHISDFRERIRINGEMITKEYVCAFTEDIRSKELPFAPSFFEISFLMAVKYFKENDCTVCVIETGLGGRLDATNVITPLLSIITNISLEHTQFLGNSIESIAKEKAGIIKRGIPVIISETVPETKRVFTEIAQLQESTITFSEDIETQKRFQSPLIGDYQIKNLHTVLLIIEKLKTHFKSLVDVDIQKGLNNLYKNTGFFGRLQVMQNNPLILFDVSHNFDGIQATLSSVSAINKGKLFLLYGSSADKNVDEILPIFPKTIEVFLTTFSNNRSLNFDALTKLKEKHAFITEVYTDPKNALKKIQSIANKEDTILVFGSFFLLSDFF